MIGGPYVVAAVGIVVGGLALTSGLLYYRAEAAVKDAKAARVERDHFKQALADSEETIEALQVAAKVLDEQLVKISRRESELQKEKRRLKEELDALAKTLPPEDQACLDRPLPDALAERLLNDRADHKDQGREGPSTGRPPSSLR